MNISPETIFILEWNWSDGYDHSNAVIGAYTSQKAAEVAWDKWIVREVGEDNVDCAAQYSMEITEMLLGDIGHE